MDNTAIGATLTQLRVTATGLISAAERMAILLEKESIGLKRDDEVARIQALRAAILRQVELTNSGVAAGRSGRQTIHAAASVLGLIGRLVQASDVKKESETTQDKKTGIDEYKKHRPVMIDRIVAFGSGKPPARVVLIRVGPGGVPDNVDVVVMPSSASEEPKSEIIIRKKDYILFRDTTFFRLIDALVNEILIGNATLPLSAEAFSKIHLIPKIRLSKIIQDNSLP